MKLINRQAQTFFFLAMIIVLATFVTCTCNKSHADQKQEPQTRILAWGQNDAGQLGNGFKGASIIPTWATDVEKILKPGFEIEAIDGGVYSTCLLRSDQTVWCWGGGNTSDLNAPPPPAYKIEGMPEAKFLEMGSGYTHCAKAVDYTIWCWPEGSRKAALLRAPQWSKSSDDSSFSKLKSTFVDFSMGMSDECGLTNEGKVWCWGTTYSNDGDIYRSTQKNFGLFPIAVPLEKPVVSLNVGTLQTCAVLEDKSAWCWANILVPSPYRLFDQGAKVRQVFSGWDTGCALKEDGTVWCWGSPENAVRMHGRGLSLRPVEIEKGKPLSDVVKLDNQGNTLFCALRKNGTVWCWGGSGAGDPQQKVKEATTSIKSPDGVNPITGVADIAVASFNAFALVRGNPEDFSKIKNPDCSMEILSSLQSGDLDRTRVLISTPNCLDPKTKVAETALINAILRQKVDLVQALINAGVDIELPHRNGDTALLWATNLAVEVNMDVVRILVEHGANLSAVAPDGTTAIINLQREPDKHREEIRFLLARLEEKEGRRFYTDPPASLELQALVPQEPGCAAGRKVLSSAGTYRIDVPAGCSRVLVKVWGAGGGCKGGGTGGFTLGVLDLKDTKVINAIVGGGGQTGKLKNAAGGFNGGGEGGASAPGFGGSGGGGGRSELVVNGSPVVIAGGGGGGGGDAGNPAGAPGGGNNAKAYIADFYKFVRYPSVFGGDPFGGFGENGVGGHAAYKDEHNNFCTPPTSGSEKRGGTGASSLDRKECGATGGGGGGAGYGGGGGGAILGVGGGGGGGLAPPLGITLWGGAEKPAETNDPDYFAPRAEHGEDGLIVISWPAPLPEQLKEHLEKISPKLLVPPEIVTPSNPIK